MMVYNTWRILEYVEVPMSLLVINHRPKNYNLTLPGILETTIEE